MVILRYNKKFGGNPYFHCFLRKTSLIESYLFNHKYVVFFSVLITDTTEKAEESGGSKPKGDSTDIMDDDASDESEEDIFTKSLAPNNLNLKNFLDIKGTELNVSRVKKISDISEIYAFNIFQEKVKIVKWVEAGCNPGQFYPF